jgi:hypothetical protein
MKPENKSASMKSIEEFCGYSARKTRRTATTLWSPPNIDLKMKPEGRQKDSCDSRPDKSEASSIQTGDHH